jgi:hypothetical protein
VDVEKTGPLTHCRRWRGVGDGILPRHQHVAHELPQRILDEWVDDLPPTIGGQIELSLRLLLRVQDGLLHDEGAQVRIVGARRQRCRIHLNDTVPGAIDVQIEAEVEEVLVVYRCQLAGQKCPPGVCLWSA